MDSFLNTFTDSIVNPLVRLMFAVAILVFLWGLVEYIRGASEEEARSTGRRHMIWAVVGFAIMMAAVKIVEIMVNTIYTG